MRRYIGLVGGLALLIAGCGEIGGNETRGQLEIPRGLGKADSTFSCKGHCGGNAGGCYCDDSCSTYGDCCPDKVQVCDSQSTMCGGIAGLQCAAGQKCLLDGSYPDAGGKCVPVAYCDTAADCSGGLLPQPKCMGAWSCESNSCVYHCTGVPLECTSDKDCPELVAPGGNGFVHQVCVDGKCEIPSQAKKCGPILNGQCDPGYVCDIQSCGIGATGSCGPLPKCDPYFKDPVCACNGVTYNNDCMRRAAGASLNHKGACSSTGSCTSDADCGSGEFCGLKLGECLLPTFNILQGFCAKKPQACIQLYDPVCGCDGKTHGNACSAASKGVNVAHTGACTPVVKTYCKGFCGAKSPQGCYCDTACAKYGDCCPDVTQVCP